MKIFNNAAVENLNSHNVNSQNHTNEAIPDPVEWVNEHHVLAGLLSAFANLRVVLSDSDTPDVNHPYDASDNTDTDDHWDYVENYLLRWS